MSTSTTTKGHEVAAGLTQAEARRKLGPFVRNELPEKHVNVFLKLLTYFNGPTPSPSVGCGWLVRGGHRWRCD